MAAKPTRSRITAWTAFRDPRVVLHRHVKIACVEHQQIGTGGRRHGCGSPRAKQHRDLAEEMADAEVMCRPAS
jgi:hypothetical protein